MSRKDRPDLQPGFWPNYQPPANAMADAIQYPLDARWAGRVINAYMAPTTSKAGKKP